MRSLPAFATRWMTRPTRRWRAGNALFTTEPIASGSWPVMVPCTNRTSATLAPLRRSPIRAIALCQSAGWSSRRHELGWQAAMGSKSTKRETGTSTSGFGASCVPGRGPRLLRSTYSNVAMSHATIERLATIQIGLELALTTSLQMPRPYPGRQARMRRYGCRREPSCRGRCASKMSAENACATAAPVIDTLL